MAPECVCVCVCLPRRRFQLKGGRVSALRRLCLTVLRRYETLQVFVSVSSSRGGEKRNERM